MPQRNKKMSQPRVNKHREAMKKLWAHSDNLPAPPEQFDADKIYHVKLTKAVMPSNHSFHLKPSQDVLVNGKVAQEIREFISGAKQVG
jgi:hypothetical protein